MKLMEPIQIGSLQLKNRIVMAPMGVDLGNYDKRTRDFFLARAKGGTAMLLCNTFATTEVEGPCPSCLLNEESFEDFQSMVEEAHQYGCKICVQIHPGNGRITTPPPGRKIPLGASAVPAMDPRFVCEEITKEEIKIIQNGFRSTANYAKKGGADAIEIHAYGGYLTDQFLTKRWNVRTDEYGGSLENRMRFLTELIDIVQEDLGKDFPLIVKFTPCHYLPVEAGYRGMEEGLEIARILEAKGVHALHVDAGCHDNWYLAMPPVYHQEPVVQMKSAKAVKNAVNIPVISHGRLGNIAKAEQALADGSLDIVAIGRGLLADPELPNKIEQHRTAEIRPCISCNEGCIARVCMGKSVECAINPNTGHEGVNDLTPAASPKKVLVVGAGPGGCAAALTAKRCGHQVELWEKQSFLGGKALAASGPVFKQDMKKLLDYYQNELTRLGVPVRFCMEATMEKVDAFQPDAIIWAAGADAICPASIPGIKGSNVVKAIDVLTNTEKVGENAAVIGGGLVGCELAADLAIKGRKVSIIEMGDRLIPAAVFMQNAMMLRNLINHPNIVQMPKTKLVSIQPDHVVVSTEEGEKTVFCDTVVLSMGFRPDSSLADALAEKYPLTKVGDSIAAGMIYNAVHTAYEAVRNL